MSVKQREDFLATLGKVQRHLSQWVCFRLFKAKHRPGNKINIMEQILLQKVTVSQLLKNFSLLFLT